MGEFNERMARMVVKGVSPRGAVRVRFARSEGFVFEVAPKAMDALDADALEAESSAALSGLLDGMRKGIGMARDGDPPPKSLPAREPSDPPLRPTEAFRYAVAAVDVTGSAAGGLVKVHWHSEWDASVRLKASVTNRMDATELAAAMGRAAADAMRARATALVPLIRQTFNERRNGGRRT